jgi:hypothetical protein
VRSHSRLDLYAKSLAVTLLGCLGAVGALIDYWPGQTLLPDVPFVAVHERTPSVLTVVNVRGYASPASDISFERVSFLVEPAQPARRAASNAPRIVRANLVTARPMAKVTFVGPKPSAPQALTLAVNHDIPALPVETLTELSMPEESWELEDAPTVLASNHEDEGFLSGVWRRTGSSVGTVGTKITRAGGSVVGAFRSVGDLVKRAF